MTLDEQIAAQIVALAKTTLVLPCVTIVHKIADGSVVWMCDRGLKQLNVTLNKLIKLGKEGYYDNFFNPEDVETYLPKILGLLDRNNDDESVSYLQQVKIQKQNFWTWHMSCTKILMRDDFNQPLLLITQSIPLDTTQSISIKADKILEENRFLRENIGSFSKLTKREIEILKCFTKGETAIDCGKQLFISPQTVETHRKNIRKKLGTSSFGDLLKFARAFDVVTVFLVAKAVFFSA